MQCHVENSQHVNMARVGKRPRFDASDASSDRSSDEGMTTFQPQLVLDGRMKPTNLSTDFTISKRHLDLRRAMNRAAGSEALKDALAAVLPGLADIHISHDSLPGSVTDDPSDVDLEATLSWSLGEVRRSLQLQVVVITDASSLTSLALRVKGYERSSRTDALVVVAFASGISSTSVFDSRANKSLVLIRKLTRMSHITYHARLFCRGVKPFFKQNQFQQKAPRHGCPSCV
jgi:hypothetical protein